jgi:hypothetical protein
MGRGALSAALSILACGMVAGLSTVNSSGQSAAKGVVTFNKDVARIIQNNCMVCHRSGQIGPMALTNYKEVRPWAKAIREAVVQRTMPPWHADPHYGNWSNDRRLSDADINTISAWVDGGVKEGDPADLPKSPVFSDDWAIGKPDVVFTMKEEQVIQANSPDDYIWQTIPTNFTEDKYIQALEIKAGNPAIVHHAALLMQEADNKKDLVQARNKRRQTASGEDKPIFEKIDGINRVSLKAPVLDDACSKISADGALERSDSSTDIMNLLGGLAPGKGPDSFPEGMVLKIPAGASLVFQMHYANFTGNVQKDRSSVGLIFAKKPPTKRIYCAPISNYLFEIPPGASNHLATACYTARENIHIIRFSPHMHLRGKDMEVSARYPDGRSETLLSVPNYFFSWQTAYQAKAPVAVPKGTRIAVTAHFDNSANNKFNPDSKALLRWGDSTRDEMLSCVTYYYVDDERLPNNVLTQSRK